MSRSPGAPRPLRAVASVDVASPPYGSTPPAPPLTAPPPPVAGTNAGEHYGRLREGVRRLRTTARSFRVTDRTLLVVGGILAPVGLLVIVIGWWGAAHSPFLFQQVPYLISGGVFGLALVVIGAFLYFAYWLTQLVKEQRRQTSAIVEAIARLERAPTGVRRDVAVANGHAVDSVPAASGVPATAAAPETAAPAADAAAAGKATVAVGAPMLVATARGSMAHRPDCVVVAGKANLRQVTVADALGACRLCDPYGPA